MKGKVVKNKAVAALVASFGLVTVTSASNALATTKDNEAITNYLNSRVSNPQKVAALEAQARAEVAQAMQAMKAQQLHGQSRDPEELPNNSSDWANPEELLKQLEVKDSITAETTDLLGEQINLDTGTLSFSHTDVSIPGNFDLPVEIKRSYKGAQFMFSSDLTFGDWEIDIPMVTTELMGSHGFGYSGPWGQGTACVGSNADVWNGYNSAQIWPREYWNGDMINIPGKINERLLHRNTTIPNTTGFERVTKSGWRVDCVFDNSEYGQHFKVHGPDGTVYTLDVPRLVGQDIIKKNTRYKAYMMASKVEDRFGNTVNYDYDHKGRLTSIIASDGRTISLEYNYDVGPVFPVYNDNVSDIYVNGRHWKYHYKGSDTPSDTSDDGYTLLEVERPDGKKWEYSLWQLSYLKPKSVLDHNDALDVCKTYTDYREITATVKHPDGARGTFVLKETLHGRANTDQERLEGTVSVDRDLITRCFYAFSLKQKTLAIPNQSNNYVWNYSYNGGPGYYGFDVNNQVPLPVPTPPSNAPIVQAFSQPYLSSHNLDPVKHRSTSVIAPDNTKTVYYHNRDFKSPLDGRLVVTEIYDGTTLIQSTVDEYESSIENNPPVGTTIVITDNSLPHTVRDRKLKSSIYQFKGSNWSSFETSYSEFNDYNVPTLTTEYQSDIGKYRYTKKSFDHYFDSSYTGFWLLNIPTTTEIGSTTSNYKTVEQVTYHDGTKGRHYLWQPNQHYSFGRLSKTHSEYHSDGNVKKVEFNVILKDADGVNSPTGSKQFIEYGGYKRGQVGTTTIPKRYSLNETKTITRSIDNNGWVEQTQDFGGNVINYTYDDLGRLQSIRPHNIALLGTGITWDSTGLVQTTKRCTIIDGACTTGTAVLSTVKTFDGLFRELNSITTDIASGIAIKQVKEHNAYNKVTFESRPFKTTEPSKATAGNSTIYDKLLRPITQREIAENDSVYTTTTEYLLGNKVKVTDPRNYHTTTTYLAYGKPEQKQAILIESPEEVTTALDIDVYGNIKTITQSGKHNGADISITETRSYDSLNQLCRSYRPDVGLSTYRYHDNGQLRWESNQNGTITNGELKCGDSSAIPSNVKKAYLYDNNGQNRQIIYGQGYGADTVEYTYDINGELQTLKAGDIQQNYVHNSLRQLTSESLHILNETKSWTFGYTYDTLGTVDTMTYPDSVVGTLQYSPNAFGQPTQVVGPNGMNYATNASYYANNTLDSFTYGNGIVYKKTLNERGLPEQIRGHKDALDKVSLSYGYDDSKNINRITDNVDNNYSLFTLSYDGLDRLTGTTGGSHIGGSVIRYDSLGNIVFYKTKNTELTYAYDTVKNRLQTVTDTYNRYAYDFTDGYDARGNVTNNGSRSFHYNLANHMTESTSRGITNTYVYDGHNRRVISNDSKGKSYSFYSKKGKLLFRQSDLGQTSYIHLGKELVAKDGYLPQASNSRMHYKPYGDSIETPKDDIGYTGHKHDTDLKLTYMQQRYYDPVIGRFMGNDPVGYTAKNPVMSFNRYLYVSNNPYKYTDPNGEFQLLQTLTGAAIGGAMGLVSGALTGVASGLTAMGSTGVMDSNMMAKSIIEGALGGAIGGAVGGGLAAGLAGGDFAGVAILSGMIGSGIVGMSKSSLDQKLPSRDLEKEKLRKSNESLKEEIKSLKKELKELKDKTGGTNQT